MHTNLKTGVALLAMAVISTGCTGGDGTKNGTVSTYTGSPTVTIQGTMKPGSGRGVLCRTGGAVTVQTLDFFTAKSNQAMVVESNDRERELDQLATMVATYFRMPNQEPLKKVRTSIRNTAEKILTDMQFLPASEKLALIADPLDQSTLPPECEHVQIAAYAKGNSLQVDSYLWANMTWTQKANFLAREVVEPYLARHQATGDGRRLRRFVGALYSENAFAREGLNMKSKGLPRSGFIRTCIVTEPTRRSSATVGTFFVFEHGLETILLFDNLKGLNTLSHTAAMIPMRPPEDFPAMGSERPPVEATSDIYIDDVMTNYELELSWEEMGPGRLTLLEKESGQRLGDYRFSCRATRP